MLTRIKGIGEKTKQKYNKLGIFTPYDLLFSLPGSYADLSQAATHACEGCYCKIDITVKKVRAPFRKGKLQIFRIYGSFSGGDISAIWFNQNYVSKAIAEGDLITVFGKLSFDEGLPRFVNPLFEKKTENSRFEGIKPIYRTKGVVSQRQYAAAVKSALDLSLPFNSVIDETAEKECGLMPFAQAVQQAHMPTDMLSAQAASQRIIIESVTKRLLAFRLSNKSQPKNRVYADVDLSDIISNAGFTLTESQKSAVENISERLKKQEPLNAMLSGDVGSGKTIVALILCAFIARNGFQSAIMAPTEILARQHYENAQRLFQGAGITVRLLTAAVKAQERRKILEEIKEGRTQVLIGTHSLISADVEFRQLAFCVMDEQHRFGVGQRTALIDKNMCDTLTMTATPIPRSLRLALFGNIEFFELQRRYGGNVTTYVVSKEKRQAMLAFAAKECRAGKKTFIVAPRIEDSEGMDMHSVESLFKELTEGEFCGTNIGLLHGKQKEGQKQEIIELFRQNKLSALVATSVIEVGIDIPDASIMLIMDADRFGLASLHQLRGRIGRDGSEASCFLYAEKPGERLEFLKGCSDGMKIAEYDFALRGGGEFFGVKQSGQDMHGVTAENIRKAKSIADRLDLNKLDKQLRGEIERHRLDEVSLT
jgi:ATP-dependent DNA helicase RecG